MKKTTPPKNHNELLKKSYWSVQDLFWLLLGDFGFNNVVSIVQGEHSKNKELADEIKAAADLGRFGFLLNTETKEDPVGIPFSWGVEYPEHGFPYKFPEIKMEYDRDLELLNVLPTFSIHPMRIIDWIESKNIPKLIGKTLSKELMKLIENFRSIRKDDLTPLTHSINWEAFSIADFWVETELMVLLFGQTRACRYPSKEYWLFDSEIEKTKVKIGHFINNATKLEKVKAYPMENSNWEPLIPHKEYSEICYVSDYYNYVGFYESDEANMISKMYYPFKLLKLIQQKGYHVPVGLLEAYQSDENRNNILDLLKKLQENILSSSEGSSTVTRSSPFKPRKFNSGIKLGRSPLPAKHTVMQEAFKIRKDKGQLSAPEIAKMGRVMKLLAIDAPIKDLVAEADFICTKEDMQKYKEDYKKKLGVSLRTVEGWIREAFKQNTSS